MMLEMLNTTVASLSKRKTNQWYQKWYQIYISEIFKIIKTVIYEIMVVPPHGIELSTNDNVHSLRPLVAGRYQLPKQHRAHSLVQNSNT
jgi:hypothetical protein